MKIKKVLFICSLSFILNSINAQQVAMTVGLKFQHVTIDDNSANTIDYSGLLLDLGGEAKLTDKISLGMHIGILGKEDFSNPIPDIKWMSLTLDPIRYYFNEVFKGAYIGPRVSLDIAKSDNSSRTGFTPGLVLGFSYTPDDLPIIIGVSASGGYGINEESITGQGNFSIGICL